jgi:hypothetical protein
MPHAREFLKDDPIDRLNAVEHARHPVVQASTGLTCRLPLPT